MTRDNEERFSIGGAARVLFRQDFEVGIRVGERKTYWVPNVAFSLRRWTSMKVTMPRYELQPVTMARMENSRTCGSL
jgi:hypothetical protein